ncbi:hypothetical protein [Streptomyces sp. MZ04]|nr:hypothetical protein [Streptomyces sp. MZ04]
MGTSSAIAHAANGLTSRLVLAAGRVTDPEPYREDEDQQEQVSSGPPA